MNTATHRRWMIVLLLAPALLWLVGLVILPHVELLLLSHGAVVVGAWALAAALPQFRCAAAWRPPPRGGSAAAGSP